MDSSATWTDTGLVVRAGQPLTITAAGSWQDGDSVSGPDGPGKAWPDNFLNLTDREIAADLGVSRGTVASTASRALAALARDLGGRV